MTVLPPDNPPTPASSSRLLNITWKVHHKANSSSTTVINLSELDQENGSVQSYSSDSGLFSKFLRLLGKSKSKKIPHALPSGSLANVLVPTNTVDVSESTEAAVARESGTLQPLQPEGAIHPPPQPPISNPTDLRDSDQPSSLASALRNYFFLADAPKPTILSPTPIHPRAAMESTLQLVFCARLLLEHHHHSASQSNATGVCVLDDAGRRWFDTIQEDPPAQTRIRWLVSRLVREFLKDPSLGPEAIFEVVLLGPVLCEVDYRDLLSCLIERFDQSALLNASLLKGMIQLLQSAPFGFLTDDDLVRIVSSLRRRLESTHAPDRTHVYQLVFAVSKVLEVMVRGEVKGLNRQRDHQSLLAALRNMVGVGEDEFLKFQVNYAYQMSLYLPDDETSFQAFCRYAESVAVGVSTVASVFKLDPMSALAAVEHIQQVAGNTIDVVKFNIDGARAIQATAEGVTQAAQNAYWSQKKQPWFLALQAGYLFVQEGRLVDFNVLVCNATCRDDINFQRGVCQILGEIALNPLWDDGSRRSAIEFLGQLCKADAGCRKDFKVRKWVATILQQISSSASPGISGHARTLRDDLQQEHSLDIEGCQALNTLLPIPTVFPLLERALEITEIDHELACIRFRSLEERLHPVSIPLRAKATLLAPEDQQLQQELWKQHSDGGRIPLYINLPSIDDPHCDLIGKYLRIHHNISETTIQEIKHHRKFVLICDGYDESHLFQNLYTSNLLNRPGQWEVKMIVTCRSTFLSREYQGRFYPLGDDVYHNNPFGLFEEATIVPFQERDIQDYILDFATQEPSDTPPIQRYQNYWRKLSAIPNLKDLVSNPFLLTLALREIKVTRLKLFDGFFKDWVRINIARLQRSKLSPEYRFVFENLLDYGFAKCVKDFLKSLATAIHQHQGGRPVVFFSSKHNEPWKVEFFSREVTPTLLRNASPLKQAGIRHSFIHGSLLDYFDSLTLFDPFDIDDDDGSDGNDDDDDSWGGGDDFYSGRGNSLGDRSDGLADDNGDSAGGNGESAGGDAQSTGNNYGSSDSNGGSTSGDQDSSGGTGDSSGGSSGNPSGGNNNGSRGDKNGSNGDRDGSRQRKDDARSKRKGNTTKSRPSTSSDPFSKRNLFKEPSVLQFLVERAESDPRLKKRLYLAIEQAKASSVPSMAGANAITILFKSGNLSQDALLDSVLIPSDYISTATGSTEPVQLPESNLTAGDLIKVLVTLTTPESESTVPVTAITAPSSTPTAPVLIPFSATIAQKTSSASLEPPRSDDKNSDSLIPAKKPETPPYPTFNQMTTSAFITHTPSSLSTPETPSVMQLLREKSLPSIPIPYQELPEADQLYQGIFAENVQRSLNDVPLPVLGGHIESTAQLALCRMLLSGAKNNHQQQQLSEAQRSWQEALLREETGQQHIHELTNGVLEEFCVASIKDSRTIAEILLIAPTLDQGQYRKLLNNMINSFEETALQDIYLLQGLVKLIQSASDDYLQGDDLVRFLAILRRQLDDKHLQSSKRPFHVAVAISRVIDVMAERKVEDLRRVTECEPLLRTLKAVRESDDPYLKYQASYASQALQYVMDEETALQAVLRHTGTNSEGAIMVSGVAKMDLGDLFDGLKQLKTVIEMYESIKSAFQDVHTLVQSGTEAFDSFKQKMESGLKLAWYPALRAADFLVCSGRLCDFKSLILESPCRHEPEFQWGISQMLGEIAMDPSWNYPVGSFLIYLLESGKKWTKDDNVRLWMLTMLRHLRDSSDNIILEEACGRLKDLLIAQDDVLYGSFTLVDTLPVSNTSPLFDRVQPTAAIERDLATLKGSRIENYNGEIYIPLSAKDNLLEVDQASFPLMPQVKMFLKSNRHVFLLLGDSGAGKSMFNRQLECELWGSYTKGGRIPLYINLPAIDRPDQDLIAKQLAMYGFKDSQIMEMKQNREFTVICDGYDESRLQANLYGCNQFNQPLQWKVRMIISCRSTYLPQDYRGRFEPVSYDKYVPLLGLFQEAVIVPFSSAQIAEYIGQFAQLKETRELFIDQRVWDVEEYMDKLRSIPNMMELVRNPFLLKLSVKFLPSVYNDFPKVTTAKSTRLMLYDRLIDEWIRANQMRIQVALHCYSLEMRTEYDKLVSEGFAEAVMSYCKSLASHIVTKNDGIQFVQYKKKDRGTWKEAFFGRDAMSRILSDSSPTTRVGDKYRFIHHSLVEYFYSLASIDPSNCDEPPTEPATPAKPTKSIVSGDDDDDKDAIESEIIFDYETSYSAATLSSTIAKFPEDDSIEVNVESLVVRDVSLAASALPGEQSTLRGFFPRLKRRITALFTSTPTKSKTRTKNETKAPTRSVLEDFEDLNPLPPRMFRSPATAPTAWGYYLAEE
ncbi:hypothetical protein BGZ89_001988, partial [Linnemannia elongata]